MSIFIAPSTVPFNEVSEDVRRAIGKLFLLSCCASLRIPSAGEIVETVASALSKGDLIDKTGYRFISIFSKENTIKMTVAETEPVTYEGSSNQFNESFLVPYKNDAIQSVKGGSRGAGLSAFAA